MVAKKKSRFAIRVLSGWSYISIFRCKNVSSGLARQFKYIKSVPPHCTWGLKGSCPLLFHLLFALFVSRKELSRIE